MRAALRDGLLRGGALDRRADARGGPRHAAEQAPAHLKHLFREFTEPSTRLFQTLDVVLSACGSQWAQKDLAALSLLSASQVSHKLDNSRAWESFEAVLSIPSSNIVVASPHAAGVCSGSASMAR